MKDAPASSSPGGKLLQPENEEDPPPQFCNSLRTRILDPKDSAEPKLAPVGAGEERRDFVLFIFLEFGGPLTHLPASETLVLLRTYPL